MAKYSLITVVESHGHEQDDPNRASFFGRHRHEFLEADEHFHEDILGASRKYYYLIGITALFQAQAEQVLAERISQDEDYGFYYKIEQISKDMAIHKSGPDLEAGDAVQLMTKDEMVASFGQGISPAKLSYTATYAITKVEVHSNHTLIWIDGSDGKEQGPFNEALFRYFPAHSPR